MGCDLEMISRLLASPNTCKWKRRVSIYVPLHDTHTPTLFMISCRSSQSATSCSPMYLLAALVMKPASWTQSHSMRKPSN